MFATVLDHSADSAIVRLRTLPIKGIQISEIGESLLFEKNDNQSERSENKADLDSK